MTRERWLNDAVEELKILFTEKGIDASGRKLRVSCGWPCRRPLGKHKSIGECHPTKTSLDGTNEVFISPLLENPVQILTVLSHEMIHVLDDCRGKHKGEFVKIAKRIGLVKPWTESNPGEELEKRLNIVYEKLGSYPHATLDPELIEKEEKKQGTRMIKATCPSCGYVIRTTKQWIDRGLPKCGLCDVSFEVREKEGE
jgi:hypothetical protein